jgi:hypothetical protein
MIGDAWRRLDGIWRTLAGILRFMHWSSIPIGVITSLPLSQRQSQMVGIDRIHLRAQTAEQGVSGHGSVCDKRSTSPGYVTVYRPPRNGAESAARVAIIFVGECGIACL